MGFLVGSHGDPQSSYVACIRNEIFFHVRCVSYNWRMEHASVPHPFLSFKMQQSQIGIETQRSNHEGCLFALLRFAWHPNMEGNLPDLLFLRCVRMFVPLWFLGLVSNRTTPRTPTTLSFPPLLGVCVEPRLCENVHVRVCKWLCTCMGVVVSTCMQLSMSSHGHVSRHVCMYLNVCMGAYTLRYACTLMFACTLTYAYTLMFA